jgi:2'-5' RNA ligase
VTRAVIAVPRLSDADRELLREVRARHDPQFTLVAPHVTLVFPTSSIPADRLCEWVAAAAAPVGPIDLVLRQARAIADLVAGGFCVQLVPAEGSDALRGPHDDLHRDVVLAAELRSDLPYEPHVTVARFADRGSSERLAVSLAPLAIPGRIETIEVLRLDGGTACTLATVRLATPR